MVHKAIPIGFCILVGLGLLYLIWKIHEVSETVNKNQTVIQAKQEATFQILDSVHTKQQVVDKKIDQLSVTNDLLLNQVTFTTNTSIGLQEQLNQLSRALATLNNTLNTDPKWLELVKQISKDTTNLLQQVQSSASKAQELAIKTHTTVSAVKETMEQLPLKITSVQTELTALLNDIQQKINSKNADFALIISHVDSLSTVIGNLNQNQLILTSSIHEMDSSVKDVQTILRNIGSTGSTNLDMAALKTLINELPGVISTKLDLTTKMQDNNKLIVDPLSTKLSDVSKELVLVGQTTSLLNETNNSIKTLNTNVTDLQKTNTELNTSVNTNIDMNTKNLSSILKTLEGFTAVDQTIKQIDINVKSLLDK